MVTGSRRPVSHAQLRALERHGVKLSSHDLRDLAIQCAVGQGRLEKLKNGFEKHMVYVHGTALIAVYAPAMGHSDLASPHKSAGSIITILPKEAALSGNPRSPATRFKRTKLTGSIRVPKNTRKVRGY